MLSNSLIEKDCAHFRHQAAPLCLQERRGVTVLQVANGSVLTDASGKTLLDGITGFWCVNTGYEHENIVEAAMEPARRLPCSTGYFHFGSGARRTRAG